MTAKAFVRFLIGILLATLLFSLLVPLTGIPRAQLFPPAFVYANAKGKATGVISGKHHEPTPNPFKVGDRIYFLEYRFRAPAGTRLKFGGAPSTATNEVFTGMVQVDNELYEKTEVGSSVPITYEKTYPVVAGIAIPGGGRSSAPGSALASSWIAWAILITIVGYIISPWLERIMLRESY